MPNQNSKAEEAAAPGFRDIPLLKVVPMQGPGQLEEKVYLWQSKANPGREMVRVTRPGGLIFFSYNNWLAPNGEPLHNVHLRHTTW